MASLEKSPPRSDNSPKVSSSSHKRTYQACIPCRRRKVRCDLGPVDDPHDPPCVRCRRESKECFFSATRRKRTIGDEETGEGSEIQDEYTARNSRRKTTSSGFSPIIYQCSSEDARMSPTRPTKMEYGQTGRSVTQQPTPYYGETNPPSQEIGQDQELTNETAAALFQSPINTPGDALHLLLKASGQSESFNRQGSNSQNSQQHLPLNKDSPSSAGRSNFAKPSLPLSLLVQNDNIDPLISSSRVSHTSSEYVKAFKAWSRLRFVRAGWFTAHEAISYVDYYYSFLAPLTPISPPDFSSPSTHPRFLNEEPILVVTMLTIASRYKQLLGPGGKSRSYMIHERLWNYLQNMISRMFWGQEQFGGGFCGAGSRHKSVLKGGLRNLGTIESLLLLSEFHPRSMHFPPGDDGDDILVPEEDSISPINTHQESDVPSFGESTVLGWSEPALRSDRMCWSLIGTSYTLAYELGVFGNYQDELRFIDNGHSRDDTYRSQCGERAARIKRLMYIYVNSACGRFGFPSMYQGKDNETDLSNLEKTITTNPSELRESVELIQQCWAEITAINKACNANLFSSKEKTCELIKSGGYVAILKQLQPILDAWHRKIESLELSKYPRLILLIELEYNRVYVFSLALQAVLEHWTNNAGSNTENPEPHNSVSGLYRRSEYYVKEVAKAARNILRHVVEGLLPRDYLKHAPVRTHFRILSGAMFLLKTFALGAREDEVATSLRLLDSTVNALRSSVVDDVHLCLRVADLLESLTSSIRHNFVRLAARNSNNPTPTNSSLNPQHRVLSPSSQTPGLPDKPSPLPRRSPPAGLPPNPINPQANTNNIAIMPPPNNAYYVNNNFFSNSFPSPSSTESPNSYPNKSSANSGELPSFPTEEDWLTLDLNPLLTDTGGLTSGGGGMGGDSQWFGNFGPDIDGNLEMLGNWLRDGRWTG